MTSPWGIGHLHLLPLSCEFQRAYPDIGLLLLTDNVINPVENGVDLSIRIGPLSDSSLIAKRIGSVRVVVCASSDYLAARGRPLTPADLARHDCITIDGTGVPRAWPFMEGGQEIAAPIRSKLTVSTSEAAVEAAILGSGLTRVMSYKMEAARVAACSSSCSKTLRKTHCPSTSSSRSAGRCRSSCVSSSTG